MDFEDIEARLYAQVFHTAALDDFEVVEPDTQNATASVQQNVSAIAQQNLTERYFTVNRNDTFQNVRVPADYSTDTPDTLVRSNIVSMGLMNSTSNVAAIPTILTRTFTPHFQKKGTRKDRRIQHRQLVHLKQKYERDINWRLQKETVEPCDKKRNKVAKENKSNDNLLVVSDDSSNDCFIIPYEIPLIVLNSDDEVDPTSKSEGTQEGTKATIESLSGDLQNDIQIKSNMVTTVIDNTTLDKSNLSENKRLGDIDSPVISQSVTTGDPLTDSINYVLTNRPETSQNYKTKFELCSPRLVISKSQIISEACDFENVTSKLSGAKSPKTLDNTVGDLFADNTSHSFKQLLTPEQSTRNIQLLRSRDRNLNIRHEVADPPSITNSESDFADGVIECRSPINKTLSTEGQLLGSPKSDQAICKGQTRPKRKFFTSRSSKCNKQKATNTEEINDDVYIFTDSDSFETKIPYKRQRNSKMATDTRHLEYDSDSFSSEEEVFRIGARNSLDNFCTFDLDYSEIDSSSDESSLSNCAQVIPENAAKEKEGESIIPLSKKHTIENYWCEDKERFYKENWGDENFSVVEKLSHMSNDPLKWKVLDRDKKYLKNICSKKSKRKRTAQNCKCILCGGSDHLEPTCPNKVCRMCGNPGDFSSTPCDICQIPGDKCCSICKMFGHADFLCPDQWRRYIMTTEDNGLIVPPANELPSAKDQSELICFGCALFGRVNYKCSNLNRILAHLKPLISCYANIYREASLERNEEMLSEENASQEMVTKDIVESREEQEVEQQCRIQYPLEAINAQPDFLSINTSMQEQQFSVMEATTDTLNMDDIELRKKRKRSKIVVPNSPYQLVRFLQFYIQGVLNVRFCSPTRNLYKLVCKELNNVDLSETATAANSKIKPKMYNTIHTVIYGFFRLEDGSVHFNRLQQCIEELQSLSLEGIVPQELYSRIVESFHYVFGYEKRDGSIKLFYDVMRCSYLKDILLKRQPFLECVHKDLELVSPCVTMFSDAEEKLTKMKHIYIKMSNTPATYTVADAREFNSCFQSLKDRYFAVLSKGRIKL